MAVPPLEGHGVGVLSEIGVLAADDPCIERVLPRVPRLAFARFTVFIIGVLAADDQVPRLAFARVPLVDAGQPSPRRGDLGQPQHSRQLHRARDVRSLLAQRE